ncbi:hypothetical protein VSS86_19675, partial [Bacillus safensis]|uniref:hypothetical protein n=1 Tax=Bacillus safensis TaxID=561879 RepID=UPI002DD434BD
MCLQPSFLRQRYVQCRREGRRSGYSRVRVDGNLYDLTETISLEKNKKHTIEIVVDRLIVRDGIQSR